MKPGPAEYVAGRIPVLESLRVGRRPARRLFLLAGAKGLEEIRDAARGIPVIEMPRHEIDRLVPGAVHQGVVLEAAPLPLWRLSNWLERGLPEKACVVVLDGVEDPQNFGAIIRSAAGLDAAAVLFAKQRAAPLSTAAVKASAGGVEHVTLIQEPNIARSVEMLQEAGFWTVALGAQGEVPIWDADLGGRAGLVVGGEGDGVRRLVWERCDVRAQIPMPTGFESLNASVAAGIALAERLRQIRA